MKRALALALTILLLALSGCAGGTDVSGFAPGEGERLVIYTSHKEEVYGPIVKEFQQRTGIWVEVVTGGSNELLERIAMEAESGEPVCDLMFGGGVESLAAYEDCFEPCKPEGVEYLRDVGLSADDLWTPFSSLPMVLVYNTRLVPEGEVTGWADLLLNCFSPFAQEEFLRVLRPGGSFLMVIPLENHLYGLKQAIYEKPYRNEVKPYDLPGFRLEECRELRYQITLHGQEEIESLFMMTPYYYKTGAADQQKLLTKTTLTTPAEFAVLRYKKI